VTVGFAKAASTFSMLKQRVVAATANASGNSGSANGGASSSTPQASSPYAAQPPARTASASPRYDHDPSPLSDSQLAALLAREGTPLPAAPSRGDRVMGAKPGTFASRYGSAASSGAGAAAATGARASQRKQEEEEELGWGDVGRAPIRITDNSKPATPTPAAVGVGAAAGAGAGAAAAATGRNAVERMEGREGGGLISPRAASKERMRDDEPEMKTEGAAGKGKEEEESDDEDLSYVENP
jgi:hypothetical protein